MLGDERLLETVVSAQVLYGASRLGSRLFSFSSDSAMCGISLYSCVGRGWSRSGHIWGKKFEMDQAPRTPVRSWHSWPGQQRC